LKQRSLFGPEGRATATHPGPDEGVRIRGPIFRCGTARPGCHFLPALSGSSRSMTTKNKSSRTSLSRIPAKGC